MRMLPHASLLPPVRLPLSRHIRDLESKKPKFGAKDAAVDSKTQKFKLAVAFESDPPVE